MLLCNVKGGGSRAGLVSETSPVDVDDDDGEPGPDELGDATYVELATFDRLVTLLELPELKSAISDDDEESSLSSSLRFSFPINRGLDGPSSEDDAEGLDRPNPG